MTHLPEYWESFELHEIQPVHPKGNQSWIFIGRTDAEAETSILWPPDVKNWLIWIDPDAGKDWRQEEKGMAEDEMVGWHHRHNEHEFYLNSKSWRWTGRPGVLQSMRLQRVGHDWVTDLTDWLTSLCYCFFPFWKCTFHLFKWVCFCVFQQSFLLADGAYYLLNLPSVLQLFLKFICLFGSIKF